MFGSGRPWPTLGRKELKPSPRITGTEKFRWHKLEWSGGDPLGRAVWDVRGAVPAMLICASSPTALGVHW